MNVNLGYSTIGHLAKSIQNNQREILTTRLHYTNKPEVNIQYQTNTDGNPNIDISSLQTGNYNYPVQLAIYKKPEYASEKEIRLLFYDNSNTVNNRVEVDINTLIESIYLNPFATTELLEEIKNVLNQTGYNNLIARIKESKINERA